MSTLRDRIAFFNKANPPAASVSQKISRPTVEPTKTRESPPSASANSISMNSAGSETGESAPAMRRPSVAERIAALRNNGGSSSSSSSSSSSPAISSDLPKRGFVGGVFPPAAPSEASHAQSKPEIEESAKPAVESNSGRDSPSKAPRRMSISDRIAMLNKTNSESSSAAKNSAVSSQPEELESGKEAGRKTLMDDRIAAMKNAPVHKPSVAEKYLSAPKSTETSAQSAEPSSQGPPVAPVRVLPQSIPDAQSEPSEAPVVKPTSSIAERIAAMKAKSASASETTKEEPPATAAPRGKLNGNLQQLGAKIVLPGLMPGAPRPMFPVKPKVEEPSEEVTTAVAMGGKRNTSSIKDDGSFQHLSLSRPAINSERRKKAASSRMHKAWKPDERELDGMIISSASTTVETIDEGS